ncbi:MAG: NRDE family protein [Bacteroidota bacterium]|nr:NRDE family protein [Bacteroidota bacterium]
MCTVSYIPGNEGFVLTSNRDEKSFRPTITPQIYRIGEMDVCFPKDATAGGSWIAANDKGRLCCLLNGAFVAHQKKSHYVQSRGKVLIELTSSLLGVFDFFQENNLIEIEPFTMITLDLQDEKIIQFSEFNWDGYAKHFKELDNLQAFIWSSVTLYSPEHRKLRRQWFDRFLNDHTENITPENILAFHSGSQTSDHSINVVMERDGGMKTVSITQVIPVKGKFKMNYLDLQNNTSQQIEL